LVGKLLLGVIAAHVPIAQAHLQPDNHNKDVFK
jgi:hypothetical protein